MRDLLVSTIIIGSLPVCFSRPWIGILMWSWIGYMNPHRLTSGFAYGMPFAQMVAIATLGGLFFTKDRYQLPRIAEVYLLMALWAVFFLSTLFAFYPEDAWNHFFKVSKILLMTFVALILFQDRMKLKALLWVIALSIGFFGLKGGIWAVMTGGQNQVLGPPDSFIEGNTEIGLALNMVLPVLLFLRRGENRQWLRHLLLAMFLFSIIAILITYSRGALIGLASVVILLLLKARKFRIVFFLTVGIAIAFFTLPQKWFSRMETIKTYEEDRSAMGRIIAWQLSYRLALDRPLLGYGFRPFTEENYRNYMPEVVLDQDRSTDAHNIFFQVLAEHGFTGLALYAGLILFTMVSLRQSIRWSRGDPSMERILDLAQMVEVSMVGFIVSGFFLSLSYFDLFYHFVAVVIIIKQLTLIHCQQTTKLDDQFVPVSLEGVHSH